MESDCSILVSAVAASRWWKWQARRARTLCRETHVSGSWPMVSPPIKPLQIPQTGSSNIERRKPFYIKQLNRIDLWEEFVITIENKLLVSGGVSVAFMI